jgi:hypothetical protein
MKLSKKMGYDTNECLACYCQGGGNNYTDDTRLVCLTCLDPILQGARGRVYCYFKDFAISTGKCELCSKETNFGFVVPICSVCVEDYKESPIGSEESDEGELDVDDIESE